MDGCIGGWMDGMDGWEGEWIEDRIVHRTATTTFEKKIVADGSKVDGR